MRRHEGTIAFISAAVVCTACIAVSAMLLGAPPRSQWEHAYQAKTQNDKCDALTHAYGIKPGQEKDDESKTVTHDRYIELCQQLRSALGSEDAAYWTWWQAVSGTIGAVLAAAAVLAAGLAAGFTWRQASIAEKAYANIERPWLTPKAPDNQPFNGLLDGVEVKNGWQFRARWWNSGRSPAIDARIYSEWRVVSVDDEAIPEFFGAPIDTTYSAIVGPNEYLISSFFGIDAEHAAKFLARQTKIFIYSKIVYRHMFSKDQHSTECCFVCVRDGNVLDPNDRALKPYISIAPVGRQNGAN